MDAGDRSLMASEQFLRIALARVRSGQPRGDAYMHCKDCLSPIPDARRQAMPGCTRCIACQRRAESIG